MIRMIQMIQSRAAESVTNMIMMVSSTRSLPTVQLRHQMPDGSQHVDWMIAQDADGRRPLITFRLPRRVDQLARGETLVAQRLADHRPAYLDYEGPVWGDRGRVDRIRRGQVVSLDRQPDAWTMVVSWRDPPSRSPPPRPQRLRLEPQVRDQWLIRPLPPDAPSG